MTKNHEPARGSTAAAESSAFAAPNQRRCESQAQGNIGNIGSGGGLS